MSNILKAIAVTAELTQTDLSKLALQAMESDLIAYPEHAVLDALTKCRRELKGKLTLAAVIERIDQGDGRPSANEAWGIALAGFNECLTVITNQEIGEATQAARSIYEAGDEVGARMAFRDAYERIVSRNRDDGLSPKWFASIGTDKRQRESALIKGIESKLISHEHYAPMLEKPTGDGIAIMALLENKPGTAEMTPEIKARFDKMRQILNEGMQ